VHASTATIKPAASTRLAVRSVFELDTRLDEMGVMVVVPSREGFVVVDVPGRLGRSTQAEPPDSGPLQAL
jgi:hypothetical protein